MAEHLSVAELLTSLKYCRGDLGESGCVGCPNATPGTEDKYGMCKCRFNTYDEMIHVLESLVNSNN